MARHWVRVQVTFGAWQAFCAALEVHNDDAERVGLPRYRLWSTRFGPFGEAFLEGEFASLEEINVRIVAAGKDAEYGAKLKALLSERRI
jgi:hypothetical protein